MSFLYYFSKTLTIHQIHYMKTITPPSDDLWQRLDRYLRKIFPWAKLGEIYQALRTKQITINGKKMPESTKLRSWDVVEVYLDEKTLKEWQKKEERIINTSSTLDTSRILYEDSEILVYNKPAWLIVHSPDHKTNEVSLIEQIEVYLLSKGWKPSGTFDHPALAHRIDRDTSGIIISCLSRKSYEHMAEQFRTRKVTKTYHALVSWIPSPLSGTISAPILRLNTGRTDEAKMVIDAQWDAAETHYNVITISKAFGIFTPIKPLLWSIVELNPKTGRTHQIRVHMAHIGCPLIGDKRYGGPSVTRFPELSHLKSRKWHLLHAEKIGFLHPNGKEMKIECSTS